MSKIAQELFIELNKTKNSLNYIIEQVGNIPEHADTYPKAMFEIGAVDRLLRDLDGVLEGYFDEFYFLKHPEIDYENNGGIEQNI